MTDLTDLPRIGPVLAADLATVGIPDVATFRAVGVEEAAERLAAAGLHDCGHARRALTAALRGDALAVLGVDNVLFEVADLDAAVAHYRDGLGLALRFRLDEQGIALFALGPEAAGLLVRNGTAGGGRVWLEVADARAAAAELDRRGVPTGAPFAVATGWTVEVTDAWGNTVGFTDYTLQPERARATGLITTA